MSSMSASRNSAISTSSSTRSCTATFQERAFPPSGVSWVRRFAPWSRNAVSKGLVPFRQYRRCRHSPKSESGTRKAGQAKTGGPAARSADRLTPLHFSQSRKSRSSRDSLRKGQLSEFRGRNRGTLNLGAVRHPGHFVHNICHSRVRHNHNHSCHRGRPDSG